MKKQEMINFELVRQLVNEVIEVQCGIKTSSSIVESTSKISTVYIYECGAVVSSKSTEEITIDGKTKRESEYMTYLNNNHGHPVSIYRNIGGGDRLNPLIVTSYEGKLVQFCTEETASEPLITCSYRYCDDKLLSSAVTYLESNKQNLAIYSYDEDGRLVSMDIYNDDVKHILIDIAYISGNISRIFIKNEEITNHTISLEWKNGIPEKIMIVNENDTYVESEYKCFKAIDPKNRVNFESTLTYDVELDEGEGTRKLTHVIDQFIDK